MLWIEFQRLVTLFLFGVLPPPPFDIAFRLSLNSDILCLCAIWCSVYFVFILFSGTYPRPFHWPPAWFMSLCELVPSPLAGLFYFVSFCFYWYVSPSLHLAACLLPCTGRLVVRASPYSYLCCISFFSPRIACRGAEGSTIFLIFLFTVVYRPADPRGSIIFSYPFRGMLACDHGNRPSQVLE